MSDQTYNQLQIEGDPTTWGLNAPIEVSVLTDSDAPFVATVTVPSCPLATTLVLSRGAAASVSLLLPIDSVSGGGPLWTDVDILTTSWLYLPTATGLTEQSPGYALPAGTDLAELQTTITTALTAGTLVSIVVAGGAVVLNGATLPFAAILTANPAS